MFSVPDRVAVTIKDATTLAPAPVPKSKPMPMQLMADPFVFVPISQAEAAKGRGAAKRIVRAHVTRVQHAKSTNHSSHMQHLQTWTVKPYIHREPIPIRRKARVEASAERRRPVVAKTVTQKTAPAPLEQPSASSSIDLARRQLNIGSPRLPAGGASEDPFWSFPVDYQPSLSPIFAHYIQNVAVDIPDIDGPDQKGLLRRVWFPLCMTEAATMYAVLLMAASHYCVINPTKAVRYDLLALKARALSEINIAMSRPGRAVSDAIIGAVAKMAAYEAVFGDSTVFMAHMKGLQKMLEMRGGLGTLGLNGLLERMLVWINLNASWLTGIKNHEFDALPTIVAFDGPDPYHFAGIA